MCTAVACRATLQPLQQLRHQPVAGTAVSAAACGRALRGRLSARGVALQMVPAAALLLTGARRRSSLQPWSLATPSRLQQAAQRRNRGDGEEPVYLSFDDILLSEPMGEFHLNQLGPVVGSLQEGGMGLVPTDTQHAYVTSVSSKIGTRRIYDIKGVAADERKPLSLLCSDLSMASHYSDMSALPRRWFQLMRRCLPGPYTFILRASPEVPRVVLENKAHRKMWKRKEVGIRVPDCFLVHHLSAELGEPLLASSACHAPSEVWQAQRHALDFVVAGTQMSGMWDSIAEADRISTVIDLTMEEPVLRRQGMADASFFF